MSGRGGDDVAAVHRADPAVGPAPSKGHLHHASGDVRERDGAGCLAARRRHPLVEPEPGGQVLGIPGVGSYRY